MKLIAKKPSDCSAREIKSFCDLLTEGGEVQEAGRSELIKKATSLVFLRDDEATIGIAGLKCPRPAYKKRVFVGAKTNQNSNHFSYELGWIYIEPKYRGLGHSHPLVEKALAEVGSNNVFATSRSDNIAMHATLTKCGFHQEGDDWPSKQRQEEKLRLFIRKN